MGRYTSIHANAQGPGDARPTARQIIHDEGVKGKLASKFIVMTGDSSGIGFKTARALAATGAILFLTARDRKKAETALAELLEPGRIPIVYIDNASFFSIRKAAATILIQSKNRVNILIANAGVMGIERYRGWPRNAVRHQSSRSLPLVSTS